MLKVIKILTCALFVCCLPSLVTAQSFHITPGDFYTTNNNHHDIDRYDQNGKLLDSYTPAFTNYELRGMAFGPDGLLYTVAADDPFDPRGSGYSVIALDGSGSIRQTYHTSNSYIDGSDYFGKITFDQQGHFYVGSLAGLTQFSVGSPNSAALIYKNLEPNDIKELPSGNLLIADDYNIQEITSAGKLVRQILSPDISLIDVRGLEYNPTTNSIFVTMLGYSGNEFQLMRLDGTTGRLLGHTEFIYGDDLFLANDGRLIVSSSSQAPGIFTQGLQQIGSFTGGQREFVTQAPTAVPEPSTLTALLTIVVGGAFLQRSRWRRTL